MSEDQSRFGVSDLAYMGIIPMLLLHPEFRNKAEITLEKKRREIFVEKFKKLFEDGPYYDITDMQFVCIYKPLFLSCLQRAMGADILNDSGIEEDLEDQWTDLDEGYETRYD